jgi:aerobic carbon-monoxide dehydrogenase medium subunit
MPTGGNTGVISQEIEFHAPQQLGEALALLDRLGDEAKVLAGGMSLVPAMSLGLAQPRRLISLNRLAELEYIRDSGDSLAIGAQTRHAVVAADPPVRQSCQLLSEAAGLIGDVPVRHRGTIGGSLAHADPAGNYAPVVVVLGAELVLRRAGGERVLPAHEFFVDLLQTQLAPNELLVEVRVPKLPASVGSAYLQLTRVEGSFPIASAAAVVEEHSARVAIGAVRATPILVDATDYARSGGSEEALRQVGQAVEAASAGALEDLNGDEEYRRAMARVFAERALKLAASRR